MALEIVSRWSYSLDTKLVYHCTTNNATPRKKEGIVSETFSVWSSQSQGELEGREDGTQQTPVNHNILFPSVQSLCNAPRQTPREGVFWSLAAKATRATRALCGAYSQSPLPEVKAGGRKCCPWRPQKGREGGPVLLLQPPLRLWI